MRATPLSIMACLVLLTACSEAPSPTGAPRPDLSVTTASVVPIPIHPGVSIQAVVDAHPSGTTFLIKTGRHVRQSVIPKSGNSFIGEPGAILDGENATEYAFKPAPPPYPFEALPTSYPVGVRIAGLIIERYTPALDYGAILAGGHRPQYGTTGWVVENCEIRYNATGGIRLGHQMRILRNNIHHNRQFGIIGRGDNVLVEGNEIAYNNYLREATPGRGAGGTKFVMTRGLVVRGNFVHHNYGSGLWTDIDNINTLIEGNRVEDNSHQGIFHEISYAAVIRNNVVRRNGFARAGQWLYGAGIMVSSSGDVEVSGNRVEGNANGITGVEQNRGIGTYGPYWLKNFLVHDNTVTMTTGMSGVGQGVGDNAVFTSRNNRFEHNTYYLGRNAKPFAWMNAPRTEAQWRGYGNDVTGTFNR